MSFCVNILLVSFLLIGLNSFAQTDSIKFGKLEVNIVDEKTKKPIEYAVVTIQSNTFKKSKYSDKNSNAIFDSLLIGNYSINASVTGYLKIKTENSFILKDSTTYQKFEIINTGKSTCIHCDLKLPQKEFIKPDEPTHQNLNRQQIMRMPY
jgi:hypothetical protein